MFPVFRNVKMLFSRQVTLDDSPPRVYYDCSTRGICSNAMMLFNIVSHFTQIVIYRPECCVGHSLL